MTGQAAKILVVDDEPWIHKSCQKILAPEGHHVEEAEDGVAGLALFEQKGGFDAVLIDIKMPRMDGIELVRRIHEIDEDALLLIITGHATIETAVEAIKGGAYDYIPKPFTPDELLLPLRRGLEHRSLTLEAKRLLLDVARERSRSGAVIACMTDGVVVVNRQRRIVLCNNAARRVLRCGESEELMLSDLGCSQLERLFEKARASEASPLMLSEEVQIEKDTYQVSVSPITDSDETAGIVAVFRDITERKKLETAKSLFVSWVAHEIKSPLAVSEGMLQLLLNKDLELDELKRRDLVERSLKRLGALRLLVSDLTSMSALETGNFPIERITLNIREIIEEVLANLEDKARAKDIVLTLAESSGSESVFADRNAMRIVLSNLIENAVKYTPDRGKVNVRIDKGGHDIVVTVTDNGIGMTEEECEKVFDEFFRAKNKYTESVAGTGLGLSIVKQLVDRHDGRISVDSKPGKGTTFTVAIPIGP